MEISRKSDYYNAVFIAVIVNADIDQDPQAKGRVQIFIPTIHTNYLDKYQDYMNSSNKESQDGWSVYPWATTLVKDIKNGNIVYATNINNKNSEYMVIGLDVNNIANADNEGLDISSNLSGLLDLTMPIIIHNEVGIATIDWPDNIANSNYIKINPYDKGCSCSNPSTCPHSGGWSIGLIQWHHTRAFDCLFEIAKADTNWQDKWTNKSLDLYNDLVSSINSNSSANYRTKYQDSFHPISGTSQYQSIQNMLGSDIGKTTQRDYASQDTSNNLETLMGDPYNINNPAILIFLADIMNQYGAGLPNTIKKAASISSNGNDMMSQLSEFREYCKNNIATYNTYIDRRNTTYTYIENLYNTGKLNIGTVLTDVEGANQGGQLLWPCPGCQVVTSKYGMRTLNGKTSMHTGVDLARNGDATGQEIIASHSGTITTQTTSGSYGVLTKVTNGTMTTYYAHQSRRANGITDGVSVKAGQVIGYVGSTGNSTGAHLHFEVRINNQTQDPLPYIRKS